MFQIFKTTFYSKDIREIGAVIANTEIFIGADSGIMHLASASLTPTVGLFSRPNQVTYAPYNNDSTAIRIAVQPKHPSK
jgi:ADP-heptose:LPS heptosyltransferase